MAERVGKISRRKVLGWMAAIPGVALVLEACGADISTPVSIPAATASQRVSTGPAMQGTQETAPGQLMVKPATANLPLPPNLDKKRPAPDFDNEVWINSDKLTLGDLKGKVVLVEFWTFGCINCQNVQPALKRWYDSYASQGMEIVAFHDPEFDNEKNLDNVKAAAKERGLKYPIAIDNDFKTWNKYAVRAWPTLYLLDKQGQIRFNHIGEGQYDVIESAIVALLNEA